MSIMKCATTASGIFWCATSREQPTWRMVCAGQGRVGVCLVTSGPGATNTVTGVATANMDSVPIVVFTGQVPTAMIGDDAFRKWISSASPAVHETQLSGERCKRSGKDHKEAFYLAKTGRPGPIVVDLPKDMLQSYRVPIPEKADLPGYRPTLEAHMGQIKKAYDDIKHARRPVIYAGGGIIHSRASEELAGSPSCSKSRSPTR